MAVVSLWTTASVPTVPANPATTSIEVGLQFSTSNAGSVTGIRFYKDATNTGTHVGTLWSPAGASLATVTFTGETASGWQTGVFTTPVAISTGQNYVVSVFDPNGHYPSDQNYFTTPLVNTPLTGITGVFHNTTSAFPASTFNFSNYWVDLLLDTGSSPVSLAAALVETNTLNVALNTTNVVGNVVSLWTTSTVPASLVTGNGAFTAGLRFSTSTVGSVVGVRFYKPVQDTGTHIGTLWDSTGVSLATVTFTGETASGWQTATFATSVAIATGQTYTITVYSPVASLNGDNYSWPYVNLPLTGTSGCYVAGNAYPTTSNTYNTWADVLLDIGSATAPLMVSLIEPDALGVALVSPTSLAITLLEMATLSVALSTQGAPVTLAVVPSFGTIPFTVTATATAYAAAGAVLSYAFAWGDGATTAPNASASATHSYVSSGIYSPVCTVSSSSIGGTLAATAVETDTLSVVPLTATRLVGALRETDTSTAILRSAVSLVGGLLETDTGAAALVSAATGTITHGQQMNATNTGIAYAGLTVGQLTTAGSTTYSTAGQVITNMYFTGPVVLNAANITLRNCQIEASGSATKAVEVTSSGALIENCTIVAPGATSGYMGIHMGGSNLTVRRCNISKFENNMTIEGGPTLVEYSFFHDSSNVSNPTGHRDCVEIYGGDDVTLQMNRLVHPAGETSVINLSPWYGSTNVLRCTVQDCFLDGGNMITLVDLQSTGVIQYSRFLRNKLGGHTDPAVLGSYAALNNVQNRPLVQTAAAQTSNPNAILWPTTGADVSYWDECADLVPNRTGQIVLP